MNSPSKHQPWTDVAVFKDLNTSRNVESLLTTKGLPTRIFEDKLVRRLLFLRPPHKTFRLQVHTADFKRAQETLHAGSVDSLRDAIHCPDCGSLQVAYPQMTRKFVFPTILLHLGILLRLVDHQCYCEKCHWMWGLSKDGPDPAPKVSRDAWPNPS